MLSQPFRASLEGKLGAPIRSIQPVSGGCINAAWRLDTAAGRYFLKTNSAPLPMMFAREAEGLAALAATGAITVPHPIAHGEATPDAPGFLLAGWIESGPAPRDFQQRLGRALAALHRAPVGSRYGFPHDNYIGATPQENAWGDDWIAFYRDRRLAPQLCLAAEHGRGGTELQRLGARLLDRLPGLLAAPDEPPALLHGDLWGGNVMTAATGAPVLIDPATYHGHREADLAMTTLFGGFTAAFLAAYHEAHPLANGWRDREPIYQLYHLLNHLNLFGGVAYLPSILRTMERIVG